VKNAMNEVVTVIRKSSQLRNAEILSQILSETYRLFLKTQYCNWHVSGPIFISLHLMFDEQQSEMFGAIDDLAERIRGLNDSVPTNFMDVSEGARPETSQGLIDYHEMIQNLAEATQEMISQISLGLIEITSSGDLFTQAMLVKRIKVHQKNLWVLQSYLAA
jgi:starvation-inducible DNA-binding protein